MSRLRSMFRENRTLPRAIFLFALLALPGFSQYFPNRFALVLADPPVGERFASRESLSSAAAVNYRQQVEARQRTLVTELRSRGIAVTGSVSTLLNAVFVTAPAARRSELNSLAGVLAVVPMRRMKRNINAATQLVNAPAAWADGNVGGRDNAGKGIRIAIIDTGIDQNHPAFQDSSLAAPNGYPICTDGHPEDCRFTNSKVIVARSYVRQLAAGDASGASDPATSRPDDYSPRDRVGHGTAVASVAAANQNTGAVTFNGVAPKAFLGNYKVYGSPGVNDFSSEDLFIQAINDALDDGMNVANLSSGDPAPTTGPLDTGAACGVPAGVPCDLLATAYEAAAKKGLVVVVAAGNSGALNSISSPATAPSVIAVGATINSHTFGPTVSVSDDPSAPSSLENVPAVPSDAFWPYYGASKAPLVDVTQFGDATACQAMPEGSLKGAIALVQASPSSTCDFSGNVAGAGGIGLVVYPPSGSWPDNAVVNVSLFFGPIVGLSNADGVALRNYLAARSGKISNVTIDLAGVEQQRSLHTNQLAYYSSLGPSLGDAGIKPDLVATGGYDSYLAPNPQYYVPAPSGMYMAAQSYDPLGFLYSSTGYAAADGTSFAAPLVAGAAALIKQSHPGYSAQDIKSALVNSANASLVTSDDFGDKTTVQWTGAGLLDAGAAVKATVVADPPAISFGALNSGSALPSRSVAFTNKGSSPVTLLFSVTPQVAAANTSVTVNPTTLALGASGGAADHATVTFTLSGPVPAAGVYTGFVTLASSNVTVMKLPYMFLTGSNTVGTNGSVVPFYAYQGIVEWMAGMDFGPFPVQLLDSNGLPVTGKPVTFTAPAGYLTMSSVQIPLGNGAVRTVPPCTPASSDTSVTCSTDNYGVAWVDLDMGSKTGMPSLTISAENNSKVSSVSVNIRQQPAISSVSDVAQNLSPIAPGSYISIFGSGLSDFTGSETTTTMPLALAGLNNFLLPQYITVSFDVPSAGLSVPGRMVMASPLQVNVLAPWELQGLPAGTSAQVKVTINDYIGMYEYGKVFNVPLADVSPSFLEIPGTAVPKTVAALIANSPNVVTATAPAPKSAYVELYANGLGPVNNQPASGEPAVGALSTTKNTPTVKIGGQTVPMLFSGLAPGFPGLYQVNIQIPANAASGVQDLELTIAGKTARSKIAVQ
jgi:minor extracellular serine protease Vpr